MLKRIMILLSIGAIAMLTIKAKMLSGSTVKGVVRNGNNLLLPNVKITLFTGSGTKKLETTSSNQGVYTFPSVSAGTYFIQASANGYQTTKSSSFVVTEGKTSIINDIIMHSLKSEKQITAHDNKKFDNSAKEEMAKYREISRCGKIAAPNATYIHTGGEIPIGYSQQQFNTEEYDKINDNEFKDVTKNPLSTLSIDVDKASYSNVRRYINNGSLPPKDAVRVEEMINYFSYNYPQPKGANPFSINMEASTCPWNKNHQLIHVGLQGKKIKTENLPAANLVFLIDVSGSMSDENKLPLLKKSFALLVEQLREQDRIALTVYAGSAGLVLPSTPGNQKKKILDALENLSAGGSTAGGAGIQLAYKVAKENFIKDGNNRVILATDGDFNVGVSSNGDLVRLIEEKREEGTFLTVLGFGMGNYKDSKMEQLADKGNGNYAYIDNILEAKKVFVNELGGTLATIAKDVKIQVEFNPEKVKAYRLVGYENRLLASEDFNDDKKDAGEMGAGHSVTALYEIIPAGSEENLPGVDPLKYQQTNFTKGTNSNEIMTIKFRYKEPDGNVSKLITETLDAGISYKPVSENFTFSAAVAEFGMLLRDSKFKGTSTYKDAIALAKSSKGKDEEGYRAEMVRLMEMAELIDKNVGTGRLDIEEER